MSGLRGLRLPHWRRRIWAAALAALVLASAALGAYLYERNRTGDIYHPHARFLAQPTPKLPARGPSRFSWPLYGYDKQHTRFFPAPPALHPPFKTLWLRNSHALLEFPPVIYGERIFQLADDAVLSVLDKRTGHVLWTRTLGQASASSPAVTFNTVYVTILSSGHPQSPGRVIALNSSNGAVRWWRALPSPSESSPLIDRGHLYFGTQSGLVYALDDRTGAVLWTYKAAGAVKASPTVSDNVLYFGDYSGHLQAVSEQTGRALWVSSSEGALLGNGTFYSTAAVIYGRVFLGNTDGRFYAYDAATGALDWAVQTGDYVYSSPAVTNAPGSARPSTSAHTAAPSTRSTRARGTWTGASMHTGASPARRRSSGARSSSPTSASTSATRSASPPGACSTSSTPAPSTPS